MFFLWLFAVWLGVDKMDYENINLEKINEKAEEIWLDVLNRIEDDDINTDELKIRLTEEILDKEIEDEKVILIARLISYTDEASREIKNDKKDLIYR